MRPARPVDLAHGVFGGGPWHAARSSQDDSPGIQRGPPWVVLGCHYTNTPVLVKDQVTALVDGDAIQLTGSNAVLRTGDGDR